MSNALWESLVPEMSYRAFAELLEAQDKRDHEAMQAFMDYYTNEVGALRPESMPDDIWRDRLQAWTPVPLAAMIVDAISGGLYNREVERTTGRDDFDSALAAVWETFPTMMLDNARSASIMGDSVLRILPNWRHGLTVTLWDARHIVPIYDEDDLSIVGFVYDYLADPVAAQIARLTGAVSARGAEDRKELITRNIRDRETGEILQRGIRLRFVDGKRVPWSDGADENDGYNPLGDYLDGVFWRNESQPGDVRGQSDLAHLLRMLQAVNEANTDARQLLIWNIFPILWTSAEMEEQPAYHPRAVWQLPASSSGQPTEAGRLEWSNDMTGFSTFFDHNIALIHETARVPAVATGDLTHVGELSSGRAYEIAMSPFMNTLREREQINRVQEMDLMHTMVATAAYQQARGFWNLPDKPFAGLVTAQGLPFLQPDMGRIDEALSDASVTFAPMQIAENAMEEAQVHSIRIGAGIESVEEAIRATHPEWADEQVAEELERLGENKAQVMDAAADLRIEQQRQEMAAGNGTDRVAT